MAGQAVKIDRFPRLLTKNKSYSTYQFHCFAGDKGGNTETVLKVAVLETMKWLRERFREFELPYELNLPIPEEYKSFDLSSLQSFHIDVGYKLDICWLEEERIWTMQLTEPDLGVESGDTSRDPVPGRLFETNVSYTVTAKGVECGFNTVVHEPEDTKTPCEVFRLAIIKTLIRNPLIGLRTDFPILEKASEIKDIKSISEYIKSGRRQIPLVFVSELRETNDGLEPPLSGLRAADKLIPLESKGVASPRFVLPKQLDLYARKSVTYAQFYVLRDDQREALKKAVGFNIDEGEIVVVEPAVFGGRRTTFKYGASERLTEKTLTEVFVLANCYLENGVVS